MLVVLLLLSFLTTVSILAFFTLVSNFSNSNIRSWPREHGPLYHDNPVEAVEELARRI
jgi:hypothetical protein